MALTLAVDTYITANDAAAYLEAFGPEEAVVSERDLRQATLALDRLYRARFSGQPTDPLQPLFFPINGGTTIPTAVAQATVELALIIADDVIDLYEPPKQAVSEYAFEIPGAIKESTKYAGTTTEDPRLFKVSLILAPLLRSESSGGITFIDVVAY
jgi:hypothetical protein